jgi:hypothetical protein
MEFAVESPEHRFILPSVTYSGVARARYELRRRLLSEEYTVEPFHAYDRVKRRDSYQLNYLMDFPFQAWMDGASLTYRMYTHDCDGDRLTEQGVLVERLDGGRARRAPVEPIAVAEPIVPIIPVMPIAEPVTSAIPVQAAEPFMALITPIVPTQPIQIVEPVVPVAPVRVIPTVPAQIDRTHWKSVVLSLPIGFPVNRTDVLPYFGNNGRELARIDSLFSALLGRRGYQTDIKQVDICGYASPEGTYAYNDRLARSRSEGFKRYLMMQNYPFRGVLSQASVTWVPEDWAGLARLVEKSNIFNKETALYVIRNENLPHDRREQALKQVEPWSMVYSVMLDEIYPLLRRIELTIYYVEEVRK